ncbi:CPBP family intramembrane metalloprotease [Streptosporangium sp. NBC_01755]|uniref:CPBP family intramembrane glutamic endopeptidase n=1 Tax=unclassified Streptosporangium TaxID=2632669 RepID=UPI002DD843A4|nr:MULTISPECIES: CPBP family intramembrane glutamic endopeptidase [unclassified Streptosporangium]WSA23003.1 CPBP family intramembrane metalloprotease [Streptosporangium sp. NBC_01810]WSC98854.1 CPBP family intramembrane metalloprotease [Streptosporangium sp. NBC_01755]
MLRRSTDLWLFLLVAFGLSWLFALPLWLMGESAGVLAFTVIGVAMMFTPALGVLAVRLRGRRLGEPATAWREWAERTGLWMGERRGRTLALVALAWFGIPLLVIAAIALSAALGLLSVDLRGLSLFRETLAAASLGRPLPMEPGVLVAVQVATAFLIAPLINSIAAFGEEWGWRGWLLPRLMPLGTWRALLVSGLIWGAWHFPLTLRGYNYPELGAWAAPMFVVFCVVFGALLGWFRLYSGSVWPAVVGHGSLNASGGLTLLVGDAADPPNLAVVGITGLVGSVLLAAISALVIKRWPIEPQLQATA